jgi:hypothetical protein
LLQKFYDLLVLHLFRYYSSSPLLQGDTMVFTEIEIKETISENPIRLYYTVSFFILLNIGFMNL